MSENPYVVYPLFALGFVFLVKGADWMVEGASSLAKRFSVPDMVIGLTIVSFGTSAPELVVNVLASFNEAPDLAIGNILGSNIANILLILGIASLIRPLVVSANTIWKEIPLSIMCAVILGFLVNDALIDDGAQESVLSRIDGFILICFFIIFMYYTFGLAQADKIPEEDIKSMGLGKSIFLTLLGLVMLPLGGHWIVEGATDIAQALNLGQAVIGIVIVGVGTSLPEVAASAMAAHKGHTDIAIGNAVGSNIFNIFWVLGVSALIRELPYDTTINFDVLMAVFASFLLFIAVFIGLPKMVGRFEGVAFLIIYVVYVVVRVVHGPIVFS